MSQDITFCTGTKCPIKDTCKRYVHRPDNARYLSIFVRPPYNIKQKSCNNYLQIVKETP